MTPSRRPHLQVSFECVCMCGVCSQAPSAQDSNSAKILAFLGRVAPMGRPCSPPELERSLKQLVASQWLPRWIATAWCKRASWSPMCAGVLLGECGAIVSTHATLTDDT